MRIRIGFSFNISKGSVSNFLNTLKIALRNQRLAKTSFFINPFNDCNIFANKVRNIFNKPFFFRVDGIAFDIGLDTKQKNQTNESVIFGLKNAEGVIFQSNFAKELCIKMLGQSSDNDCIITNGVDLGIFNENGINKRNELNIESDAIVFATSAKWRTHKRLQDIINTFIYYKETCKKKCYLIIIGTAGLEYEYNESIFFIDRIERNQIPLYLRAANIFLFYSWLDNCPSSVIEAIACGVPVICTNQGGTKEIVNKTNGGIVVNADPEFIFEEVDLYNPPKPDYDLLLKAIQDMVENLEEYGRKINKTEIDINHTAKKYHEFITKSIKNF